ncbi:MAG: Uma2 family endonuclease [Acidobacteria bacterium]|nr:MAG: Uma2 family endonuclease [Acidobacteriota bacterium]
MSQPHHHHRYSYAEYVAFETFSETKHEFLDGDIYAMAGGSEDHTVLAAEMIRLLGNILVDRPCRVYTTDMRVHIIAPNLSTYPDVSVICGPLEKYEPGPEATALNPMIVVEVTSDSSEEYDFGKKREYYQTIPSLQEYVVLSHRERRITVWIREGSAWSARTSVRGEQIVLPSLPAELAVDEIYRKTSIP